jgi:hypothetical protein
VKYDCVRWGSFLYALRDKENLNEIIGRGYHTRGAEMVSDMGRSTSQYITSTGRIQIIACTIVFINTHKIRENQSKTEIS